MFKSELEMSYLFEKFMQDRFGNAYLKECQGLFGVPDFVIYTKQKQDVSIVSFELKLKNWKTAAKQAFRYKSFSNLSYVVISFDNANAALNNLELFRKYNIGLAKFDKFSNFEILYKPFLGIPYSGTLNQKILHSIHKSRKKSKNLDFLAS